MSQLPSPLEEPVYDSHANHRYAGRVLYEKVLPVAALLPRRFRHYWGLWQRGRFLAVEGDAEDWAAYVARVSTSTEEVVRYGQKVPLDVATRVFPLLNPVRYRS